MTLNCLTVQTPLLRISIQSWLQIARMGTEKTTE